jgi:glutamyl-tRNA synthetase
MVAAFDINDVNKAASAFNPDKLLWLNQQHIMRAEPRSLVDGLRAALARKGIDVAAGDVALEPIVVVQRERSRTLNEMADASAFFFQAAVTYDPKAVQKHLGPDARALLGRSRDVLAALPGWSAAAISEALNGLAASAGVGLGKVAQPLRVAVSGTSVSPPIDATLAILGRERTLQRIDSAGALPSA